MSRADRVHLLCIFFYSLFVAAGCTKIVEDRLEDGPAVHCSEHNLRLTRELDLPVCATLVGERFSVQLEEFVPETTAVVSFAPADAPAAILRVLEVAVGAPGMVTFDFPDLPAATGSRIRIQIQGKNTLNAFSGYFEVDLLSTMAGLAPNGDVDVWFWNGTERPLWHGRITPRRTQSSRNELRFSPCGRFLAAGTRAVTDGAQDRYVNGIEPVDLDLISGFERRIVAHLEATGGIDSIGFLPSTDVASVHPVWTRHEPQTGLWRLVASAFDGLSPGPTVFVGEIPGMAVPPRIMSGFETVIVISRDHIPSWLGGDAGPPPGAFLQISPDLTVRSFSCADLFGPADAAASPVEAILVDHPERGRIGLFSCAEADFSGLAPAFRVSSRWLPWDDDGPRFEAAAGVSTVMSGRLPLGWNLPPRPDYNSPMLLEGLAVTEADAGPVLLDPGEGESFELELPTLYSSAFRALMVNSDTLLIYVPTGWSGDNPALQAIQLTGTRTASGWNIATLSRDLEHALVASGELLLLANTTQMVQSTLSDFSAGMPGALIVSSSCGFLALKPSYR
ncbi:MAG: hypothetical protein CVU65_17895 [Deltaproteobacteria bacterium HGW-Deltaproteobacteria-22]|jgi:hypothetical protein|nr:MAG: hypothetical protein CVU65_17895 [Deltaproteobacteria bacterium HGW-Deltaproteobacteria-22]